MKLPVQWADSGPGLDQWHKVFDKENRQRLTGEQLNGTIKHLVRNEVLYVVPMMIQ